MSRATRELLWSLATAVLALVLAGSLTNGRAERARMAAWTAFELGDCNEYAAVLEHKPYDEAKCTPMLVERDRLAVQAAAAVGGPTAGEWILLVAASLLGVTLFRLLLRVVQHLGLNALDPIRRFAHWVEVSLVSGVVLLAFGGAGLLGHEESGVDRYLFTLGAAVTLIASLIWHRRRHAP